MRTTAHCALLVVLTTLLSSASFASVAFVIESGQLTGSVFVPYGYTDQPEYYQYAFNGLVTGKVFDTPSMNLIGPMVVSSYYPGSSFPLPTGRLVFYKPDLSDGLDIVFDALPAPFTPSGNTATSLSCSSSRSALKGEATTPPTRLMAVETQGN